jgi:ribosomal protein S6--L-glutamate ligase
MRIDVLSRDSELYSTRRIVEAAKGRGHTVHVRDPLRFTIVVEPGQPVLHYDAAPYQKPDAVIPRIGASITVYGTAVVRQFEQMGVWCCNTSQAIGVARDKLRSIQILSRHRGVGMPKTAFVRRKLSVLPAIREVGDAPVVIKLLEGTQGIGVVLADTVKVAEAIIEMVQSTRQNVLIQNFVQESRGTDVRAFVVGGRVVAAMRRTAQGDEFRSNVHRGGRVMAVTLTPEQERLAVQAAQIIGLRVAGVDLLDSNDGPLVMEVNASPGLEGIERATKVDVAGAIVQHVEEQVLFPDIDIRQRLTLAHGYGVAEIPVAPGSALVGKSIAESGLRQLDIVVLNLERGSVPIPNPRASRVMEAGDVLLCFGKLLSLRTVLPQLAGAEPPASSAPPEAPPGPA